MDRYLPADVRQYLYVVGTAVLAVLVAYKLIDPSAVPVWVALGAAVLGIGATGTAALAVNPQATAAREARKE